MMKNEDQDFHFAIASYKKRIRQEDPHADLLYTLQALFPSHLYDEVPPYAQLKIKRGLPELKPSGVKPPFDDLTLLKKRLLEKVFLSLYPQDALEIKKIVLFTWIMPDGYGDYACQTLVYKLIRNSFPHIDILPISIFHADRAFFKPLNEKHVFLSYDEPIRSPSLENSLIKADLCLQVPTRYPGWEEWEALFKANDIPTHTIGENGFIDSPDFNPLKSSFCLGLHFLEHGILLPEAAREKTCDDHYFAYLKTPRGFVVYLSALLVAHQDAAKPIHVKAPPSTELFETLNAIAPFAKELGINKIEVYEDQTVCPLMFQEAGAIVKIWIQDTFSPDDFSHEIATSSFIGCRGNYSLMEALSHHKPFIYDPSKHNLPFLDDLIALADDYPQLQQLLKSSVPKEHENLSDWIILGKTLAPYLFSNTISRDIESLYGMLKEKYDFSPFLEKIICRTSLQKRFPILKAIETLLLEQAGETISIETALSKMKASINSQDFDILAKTFVN